MESPLDDDFKWTNYIKIKKQATDVKHQKDLTDSLTFSCLVTSTQKREFKKKKKKEKEKTPFHFKLLISREFKQTDNSSNNKTKQ
jgi:hypothetical protein